MTGKDLLDTVNDNTKVLIFTRNYEKVLFNDYLRTELFYNDNNERAGYMSLLALCLNFKVNRVNVGDFRLIIEFDTEDFSVELD